MSGGPHVSSVLEINRLDVSVALLDTSAKIVAVNERWRDLACLNGLDDCLGRDYFECWLEGRADQGFRHDVLALIGGTINIATTAHACRSGGTSGWCIIIGFPVKEDGSAAVALLHMEISALLPVAFSRIEDQPAVQL